MSKKILITGAYGFVGSNLSLYLADKGYQLWALDVADSVRVLNCAHSTEIGQESAPVGENSNQNLNCYTRGFSWEQLEKIPWNEVYAVVHLAGKAHDTKNTSDPQSYFDINAGLTKRVFEIFSRKGARAQSEEGKFILFSSVKAVADSVDGVLLEDAVPDPKTPYGQSKLAAESLLRPHSGLNDEGKRGPHSGRNDEGKRGPHSGLNDEGQRERGLNAEGQRGPQSGLNDEGQRERGLNAEGQRGLQPMVAEAPGFLSSDLQALGGCKLRTYVLRPSMIHGPGNKGNLNLLYNVVRMGVPWPLGAFANQRSFASIRNVCAVVEGVLSQDVVSGTFQVADDEAISTNELIGMIAESQNKRPRIWEVPPRLILWAARVGDILHLPLNSERLKKLTESYVVSNAKIKRALGWDKMPVSAREGMLQTLRSFSGE
jgi:nucleoside-diphosphate-sugar epimerase